MTRRESYLSSLLVLFTESADLQALGVAFERSIFDAVGRGEGRVVVVSRGRDQLVDTNIGRTARRCIVNVSAVVHAGVPETAADEVFTLTHPIVMRFVAANVVGIQEIGTDEPRSAAVDGGIGVLTMQYAIEYQTAPDAL